MVVQLELSMSRRSTVDSQQLTDQSVGRSAATLDRRLPVDHRLSTVDQILTILLLCLLSLTTTGCGDDVSLLDQGWTTSAGQLGDWRDEMIYQILVDRFADGDLNNDDGVDREALGRYQGGDWQGLIDHMDYLQTLGVTALWISPAVRNLETDAGFDAYHGYWQQDFDHVNPHFGDMTKLRQMVREAHKRGFKVILDIVANHVAQLFYYDINGNGQPDQEIYGGGCGEQPPMNAQSCPQHCLTCEEGCPSGTSCMSNLDFCFYNGTGNGNSAGTCALSTLPITYISEYDPDFNAAGILGFSSLGFSAPVKTPWIFDGPINRWPTMPGANAGDPDTTKQFAFQRDDWYHRKGRITNYGDLTQVVTGDFPGGLKDLATEREDVRAALTAEFAKWIQNGDFDGFRIDTLKHVEHGFWQEFAPNLRKYVAGKMVLPDPTVQGNPNATVKPLSQPKQKFFMFGESFDGSDDLDGSFTMNQEVDSVFYFPQKFSVYDNVFKNGGATTSISNQFATKMAKYASVPNDDGIGVSAQQTLVNFMDNHDVARFLFDVSQTKDRDHSLAALYSALTYLYTEDGIPCLYYGTEQEFFGGNDPSNRERMWDTNFATSGATFQFTQKLIAIRKTYSQLRRGTLKFDFTTDHVGSESDAHLVAFERTDGAKTILVTINTADAQTSDTGPMTTSFAEGTVLTDVLNDGVPAVTAGAGGVVDLKLGPRASSILVPQGDVVALP